MHIAFGAFTSRLRVCISVTGLIGELADENGTYEVWLTYIADRPRAAYAAFGDLGSPVVDWCSIEPVWGCYLMSVEPGFTQPPENLRPPPFNTYVAVWAPDRTRISVDLPAPLPPTRATTSPA